MGKAKLGSLSSTWAGIVGYRWFYKRKQVIAYSFGTVFVAAIVSFMPFMLHSAVQSRLRTLR